MMACAVRSPFDTALGPMIGETAVALYPSKYVALVLYVSVGRFPVTLSSRNDNDQKNLGGLGALHGVQKSQTHGNSYI